MLEGLHKIASFEETIVAISTPLGHSGIGVIRVSGAKARAIARTYFKPHSERSALEHRQTLVGVWNDNAGLAIDEVVVTLFVAPNSYTGEDVIEISAHGNPSALRRIVETARGSGARIAMPGEFTLRAVAHGKMDLIQAEAVREFIESQTEQQAKTALRQMEGALSKRVRPIKSKLMEVIAHLEAGIDFAEDDVDIPANARIVASLRFLQKELDEIRGTFRFGQILTKGLRLAILGKPNVGKSSLFNRLVSAERAIVTDVPGTTRDVVMETISIDGVPLCFADTAGIRETTDRVESMGVTRTFETLAEADLALVVLDSSRPLDQDDRHALEKVRGIPHMLILNKVDLEQVMEMRTLNGSRRIAVSAKTGKGFDDLRTALQAFLMAQRTNLSDDLILTSARQHEAIGRGAAAVDSACDALEKQVPHEMVLLDLYRALGALDELTGEVVTDDILERIFSTFCIGK